ncbi:MAG TPA: AraC family transcriptional regulator [Bacteroidota bacterium]|nr:AraC family transcriptional regulator [Bacteroidota bacterium]
MIKAEQHVTTLHIKNMVCSRCIKVVREELQALGYDVRSIVLGEVVIGGQVDRVGLDRIRLMLEQNGFELLEDRRAKTVERIKHAVLKLVRRDAEREPLREKVSAYIEREVGRDYHALSTLFSSTENMTIEQYLILQRIERVKELLKYGELTLSEISYKLGYSSVQHLSNQFKKVTGMTPSAFKKMVGDVRKPLDAVGVRHD